MPSVNIQLEPVSNPDLGTLQIDSVLFPIGRTEPIFATLPKEVNSKLSRRHARIFIEQGKAYLTDLDSRNGTTLNGKELKGGRPEILGDGDLIELASDLTFRVKLETTKQKGQEVENPENDIQLILRPVDFGGELETIVVSRFPFLIARRDSVFERYNETYPEQVAQISRRHAIVTSSGGKLFIEDLGSRNGTLLNGDPIDEHTTQLNTGNKLAVGGDFFVYQLSIPIAEGASEKTEESNTQPDELINEGDSSPGKPAPAAEHTMFVDSPTSFLDIFCNEDDVSDSEERALSSEDRKEFSGADGAPGKLGLAYRQAKEIHRAFRGGTQLKVRKSKIAVTIASILVVLVLLSFLYESEADKIMALLDDKQFLQSAQLANDYLSEQPNNSSIQALGAKSLVKAITPAWIENIEENQFDSAATLVASTQTELPNLELGNEYLELLDWSTYLEQHVHTRGSIDGPIHIFKDELEIQSLLDEWNRSPQRHQQLLEQIANYVPEFSRIHKQILSHLHQLQHDYSLYSEAIDELTERIIHGIKAGDADSISSAINEYKINYPKLSGLEDLMVDTQSYANALALLADADLGTLIDVHRKLNFRTTLFEENANAVFSSRLPDSQVIAKYETSLDAWKSGDVERAIDVLRQLQNDAVWSEQITHQIERFQIVSGAYTALTQSANQPLHQDRLLRFRNQLRDSQDSFYFQATDQEFEMYKQRILEGLKNNQEEAIAQWSSYRQAGGITSIMRIEQPISRKYIEQAERLKSAFTMASTAVDDYSLVQVETPPALTDLTLEITSEVKRQRSWIKDLGVVIDPALLQSKLSLLPELGEGKS